MPPPVWFDKNVINWPGQMAPLGKILTVGVSKGRILIDTALDTAIGVVAHVELDVICKLTESPATKDPVVNVLLFAPGAATPLINH